MKMGTAKKMNKKGGEKPWKLLNIILSAIFILFTFWILGIKNGFMLRWYDEMSLFEPDSLIFSQHLHYPGGLLRYVGAFLTQLMYYPLLGTAILILLWAMTALLSREIFGLKGSLFPLNLLIPVAMLVSVAQLDEAWLSLKTPGYIFSNTLGFIVTLILYWLYKSVAGRHFIAAVAAGVIIPCFYPLFGFYALFAGALSIIYTLSKAIPERNYTEYALAAIIVTLIIALPKLYYIYFPENTVDNDFPYLKGLPELLMEKYDIYLWTPFIIAAALTLIFAVAQVCGIAGLKGSKWMEYFGIGLVCAAGVWAVSAERKSEQLRATVLMMQAVEQNDWNRILYIMSRIKEPPNMTMLVLANLAKVNLGGEAEDLSQLKPSYRDARHSEKFSLTAFLEVPVNYRVGKFNQSYRWAMEHTVQYGKRVFFLKYMVKDALMRGETKLAAKYNDILKRTMFHRKWAQDMQRYIDNPELIKENPEFKDVLESNRRLQGK